MSSPSNADLEDCRTTNKALVSEINVQRLRVLKLEKQDAFLNDNYAALVKIFEEKSESFRKRHSADSEVIRKRGILIQDLQSEVETGEENKKKVNTELSKMYEDLYDTSEANAKLEKELKELRIKCLGFYNASEANAKAKEALELLKKRHDAFVKVSNAAIKDLQDGRVYDSEQIYLKNNLIHDLNNDKTRLHRFIVLLGPAIKQYMLLPETIDLVEMATQNADEFMHALREVRYRHVDLEERIANSTKTIKRVDDTPLPNWIRSQTGLVSVRRDR